jgi:hypothetical protein
MVHVKHVTFLAFETLSLSLTFKLCSAQTFFLNGCGHGYSYILYRILMLILRMFKMYAPTLWH